MASGTAASKARGWCRGPTRRRHEDHLGRSGNFRQHPRVGGPAIDLQSARILARSGLIAPTRPDRLVGMALALARWGVTPATGYAAGAARHPHRLALVDEQGALTWREVDERTQRLAGHLLERGIKPGDAVGVLARNSNRFVESVVALAKCGADVLYLNTGSATSQLQEVLAREGAVAVLHDEDLEVGAAVPGRWHLTTQELSALADQPARSVPKPTHMSRQVILTSGTTGAPRGAARAGAGIGDAVSALSRIPLRAGQTTVIAAPVFHAWGLGQLSLSLLLGSTVVLRRKFAAEQVLRDIEQHRATALVVVPVMLDLLLAARPQDYDLSSLRVIASSGSALPGDLATRVLEAFGPVLYNLYGSTEVAYAAVATPEDLQQDPRSAGRPPQGVTLRVVDDEGHDVPAGQPGRIFVGSALAFSGYTDGTDKERLDGLICTGDLGVLDTTGRLTVLGRSDDMVVVGGENVYVSHVEDVLLQHPAVRDAAVVGADDPSYGVALVAHVVTDGEVSDADLQEWVRGRLARFAVPRRIERHDELPRNSTGKVLKRALAGK